MGGEGHPGEGGHGLALAAGGDDAHLVLGQALDVVDVHQHPFGDVHIAQLGGDPQGVFHAPAGDGHLPAVFGGHGDHLLDTVHVGGEGGDDDPLVAAPEEGVEGGPHAPLALGVARPLHVGGVAQQGQHPLLPQLAQPGQVDHAPLDGGGVDLEVAGVDDGADGGLDGEGHGVGDGVVDVDELHGEFARLDHLAGLAGDELGLVQEPVLLQLELHQARGHAGGVDGGVDAPQQVGDGADVVLMAVGEEDAPDLVLVLDEIGEVGDDHVDAVHVVVGEAHTHIHHDDVAAVLVDGEVFADLVETAQGDDLQFFCHKSMLTLLYYDPKDGRNAGIGTQQNKARDPPRSFRPCLAGKRVRSPAGSRAALSCFCYISAGAHKACHTLPVSGHACFYSIPYAAGKVYKKFVLPPSPGFGFVLQWADTKPDERSCPHGGDPPRPLPPLQGKGVPGALHRPPLRDLGAHGGLSGPLRGAGRLGPSRRHVGGAGGAGGLFRPPVHLPGRGGMSHEHPDLWKEQVL